VVDLRLIQGCSWPPSLWWQVSCLSINYCIFSLQNISLFKTSIIKQTIYFISRKIYIS
jgi:hypothetical protein